MLKGYIYINIRGKYMLTQEKVKEEKNAIQEPININKRDKYWDIVKGIGIISIVIGHASYCGKLIAFVYTYHLVIFYFISAYFYKEEKYGDNLFLFIGQKLKSTWPKYFFYSVLLILLHNFLNIYHLYENDDSLNFAQIIVNIINSMIFRTTESFAGPLWFVPTLIFSLSIFAGIVYLARRISKNICLKKDKKSNIEKNIKYLIIIFFSIICGIIGVYLNENKLYISYHLQTSFLVIPICLLGYFLRMYSEKLKEIKKLKIASFITIICFIFLIYIILVENMRIELYKQMIIDGYMFYIVSIIGICFCLSLSAIIEKIPKISGMLALVGKYSFSIMALHILCVKIANVLLYRINENISNKLWIIYVLVGIFIPMLFALLMEKIKLKVNKQFN